jgi:putative SOS response-associated peptidase YedK
MCGRYGRRSDKQRIAEAFYAESGLDEVDFSPNDDISPGSFQPVVHTDEQGETRLDLMYWGFHLPTRFVFNARSDSLATNSLWKSAFEKRRCIVPADLYFEWKRVQKKNNPKYEITVCGREPFGMAAIWSFWKGPKDDKSVRTVAVITTDPNEAMASIHDRQPAVLEPREYKEWLAPSERPPLHLVRILPAEEMQIRLLDSQNMQLPLSSELDRQRVSFRR